MNTKTSTIRYSKQGTALNSFKNASIQEMSFTVELSKMLRLDIQFNKSEAPGYQVQIQSYSDNKLPVLEFFHPSNSIPTDKDIADLVKRFLKDGRVEKCLMGISHVSELVPDTI